MPRLVEAFGSSNFYSIHVWSDEGGIRIGCPSYDHNRGGALVAFQAKDAQAVLELAQALACWALQNGAKAPEPAEQWMPLGGE